MCCWVTKILVMRWSPIEKKDMVVLQFLLFQTKESFDDHVMTVFKGVNWKTPHDMRLEWCQEHGVTVLKHIQGKWEDILQDLKLKTAKAELPGKKVSVRVLLGKWQGTYMAHVLNVTDGGIRIRHLEDDFEETLPLDALGGGKYLLEPVDSDEESTQVAWPFFILCNMM